MSSGAISSGKFARAFEGITKIQIKRLLGLQHGVEQSAHDLILDVPTASAPIPTAFPMRSAAAHHRHSADAFDARWGHGIDVGRHQRFGAASCAWDS
jgi:hypothetical protein